LLPGITTRPADQDDAERVGVPWHLKLLLLASTVYLSFRFYQLIDWLMHR
jgi:hypothetical protein